MDRPIGFIDSGVGGLTVLKEAMRQLPNESTIYLGDNARCPYGPRPAEQVYEFTWQMTNYLLSKNIKLLVIACNTATAVAVDRIREQLSIPVVGVIYPGARSAIRESKSGRIGMIGTEGTVASNLYEDILYEKSPNLDVYSLACPEFVNLVEANQIHTPLAKKTVAKRLQPLFSKKLDTLILGCTHYPLLQDIIQQNMGADVQLIDSGAEAISEVSTLLDYFGLANTNHDGPVSHDFYTSGSRELFIEIAQSWLDIEDLKIEKISLDKEKIDGPRTDYC